MKKPSQQRRVWMSFCKLKKVPVVGEIGADVMSKFKEAPPSLVLDEELPGGPCFADVAPLSMLAIGALERRPSLQSSRAPLKLL